MISNENIIRMQLINGFGRKTVTKILNHIYSHNIIIKDLSDITNLISMLGIKKAKIEEEKIEEELEKIIKSCEKNRIKIIGIYDEIYPDKLQCIDDRPLILYVDGNYEVLNEYNNIGIVGTRKPSQHGYEISSILAEKLADDGCCIVSGFASGCDEAAHKGCLASKGKTVAVIPFGHQNIPKGNKVLYNMILMNQGAIVSEIPPNKKAEKHTFIERNRIIAAISEGIIIIEGGQKGGTSYTVKYANSYGKMVAYTSNDDSHVNRIEENLLNDNKIHIINSFEDLNNFKKKSFKKLLTK